MEGISSSFAFATSAPSKHGKDDDDIEFDDDGPPDLPADDNEINHETSITHQSHNRMAQLFRWGPMTPTTHLILHFW